MIKLLEEVATIHNYLQKRVYIRSQRHIQKKKKKEAEGKIDVLRKMQIHGHIFVRFRNTRPSMLKIRRVDTDDNQIHF